MDGGKISALLIFSLAISGIYCQKLVEERTAASCIDLGIRFSGEYVSCQVLTKPAMQKIAEFFCTSYKETFCCETCSTLEMTNWGRISPIATGPVVPAGKTKPDPSCIDKHVWIADTSIPCKYLLENSAWGIHKNPERHCKNPLTDCCTTCAKVRSNHAARHSTVI